MNRFTSLVVALAALVPLVLSAQVDRSQAPEPGPAPEIILGDYTVETLENGLTLIVVENHKLPRVSYRLTLDVDAIYEGLHHLFYFSERRAGERPQKALGSFKHVSSRTGE